MAENEPYAAQIKGKTGWRRIWNASGYSLDGLKAACDEAGFRQLILLHSILILLALFCIDGKATQMILVLASFLSLIIELFNTAIEAAVDHTSLEKNPLAKRAKDVGSAAQFLGLILCGLLWIMALLP